MGLEVLEGQELPEGRSWQDGRVARRNGVGELAGIAKVAKPLESDKEQHEWARRRSGTGELVFLCWMMR